MIHTRVQRLRLRLNLAVQRLFKGLILSLFALNGAVAAAPEPPAGMVKTSKGQVQIHRQGAVLPVEVGAVVESGDSLSTGADSSVGLILRDDTQLSAGPHSSLEIKRFLFNANSHAGAMDVAVKRGSLAVISGKLAKANPEQVKFSTQSMTLAVRGTEFVLEARNETSTTDAVGTWVSGSGGPVRSGSNDCLRSGAWPARHVHPDCDPGPDRVVLLPNAQGKAGAVLVQAAQQQQLLDRPFASTYLASDGALLPTQETMASVQQRYASVLQSQARAPVSFVVQFLQDAAEEMTPESIAVLAEVRAELAARQAPQITLIGHTDTVGSDEANDSLSLLRAEAVRGLLEKIGIQARSIEVAGRGKRDLRVLTPDDVPEARNRRVEIRIR